MRAASVSWAYERHKSTILFQAVNKEAKPELLFCLIGHWFRLRICASVSNPTWQILRTKTCVFAQRTFNRPQYLRASNILFSSNRNCNCVSHEALESSWLRENIGFKCNFDCHRSHYSDEPIDPCGSIRKSFITRKLRVVLRMYEPSCVVSLWMKTSTEKKPSNCPSLFCILMEKINRRTHLLTTTVAYA